MLRIGDRVRVEQNVSIVHKKKKTLVFYGTVISLKKYFVVVKLDNGWNESFAYKDVKLMLDNEVDNEVDNMEENDEL